MENWGKDVVGSKKFSKNTQTRLWEAILGIFDTERTLKFVHEYGTLQYGCGHPDTKEWKSDLKVQERNR